jgi:hypothetical protein
MRSAGTSIVHVMDDFMVIVPAEKGTIGALTAQVNLLWELARMRLKISWKKVHPPTRRLEHLRIIWDYSVMTASLLPTGG